MIERIEFQNLKGLSGLHVEFRPLTILSGVNGSGKSTLIQSLIIAAAAHRSGGLVRLNDANALALGTATDLIDYADPQNDGISYTLRYSGVDYDLKFDCQPGSRYIVLRQGCQLPSFGREPDRKFIYLSAERNGPRDSEDVSDVPAEKMQMDPRGRMTGALLDRFERDPVRTELEHPSAGKLRFAKQVEAWLGEISPGIQLRCEANSELGKVALRFKDSDLATDWLRPANVGFGITYALPVIVAALLTRAGDILAIDSPEAHLHPGAQSTIGRFLAMVAAAGTQVVVETHSDHILNGIRLAVVRSLYGADPTMAVFNHFSRVPARRIQRISIAQSGELTDRPVEFFDQTERDLSEIVRTRFAERVDRAAD